MLRHNVVSEVMTTATPLDTLIAEYSAVHPQTYRQVRPYEADRLDDFECASVLFLNNAAYFLDDLERHDLPFVLTLYPGGGLNLGEPEAEAKLRRVLTSPLLRHVITTQPIVTEHLRSAHGSTLPLTELVGLTVDPAYLSPGPGFRANYFGSGKDCLDACFVAHRYTADGVDKGFPVFLESIRLLRDAGVPVRGHVVGGFESDDVGSQYADLDLTFSGVLNTPELRLFFMEMDLIISPTTPGVLAPGSFDGFPTGSCVEAALCGVGVVASDGLDQNRVFTDRRDIQMPAATGPAVVERINDLIAEPGGMRRLAQAGLRTARQAYGVDAQLWARRRVLESASRSVEPAPN